MAKDILFDKGSLGIEDEVGDKVGNATTAGLEAEDNKGGDDG